MAIKIESLTARLRMYVGNRRAAPRYTTHLEKALTVHIYLSRPGTGGTAAPRLVGFTRDVSETGLGVVIPDIRLSGRQLVSPDRTLHVLVGIPSGAVAMTASAVRYAEADEGTGGYLVGLHIAEMEPRDRALYAKFINSLAVSEI